MKRRNRWLLGLALAPMLAACTGPKVVTQITARGDRAKFVYGQVGFSSSTQGIIECKAAADGTLSDCNEKAIVFKED